MSTIAQVCRTEVYNLERGHVHYCLYHSAIRCVMSCMDWSTPHLSPASIFSSRIMQKSHRDTFSSWSTQKRSLHSLHFVEYILYFDFVLHNTTRQALWVSSLLSLVYVAMTHTHTTRAKEVETYPLTNWEHLALAFDRWRTEDFSGSFIHDSVRAMLTLTRTSLHTNSGPHLSLNFELSCSQAMCSFEAKKLLPVHM